MRYRRLGNTGEDISTLSLGCMRFGNEEEAVQVISKSVELGINYYETSCSYCGGKSEVWLGKGLKDQRKSVLVSTKSPPGEEGSTTEDEVRKSIDESLKKLNTDYFDFYHAWRVNSAEEYEACVRKGGWLDGVRKAMDDGIIKHIGITSHSTPKHIMEIIDDGIFEVVTVQYSLILPGYREVVKKARERGMGVIVMGPLAGGLLATPSPVLEKVFAPEGQVEGALRYVLCDPGVSSVASGMVAVKQVETNCGIIDTLPDGMLVKYQEDVSKKLKTALGEKLSELESSFCAGCRYCCSVCPEELRVFDVFKPYNMVILGAHIANPQAIAESAAMLMEKCTKCRSCEKVCPQKLKIPEHLERVREYFTEKKDA